MSQVCSHFLLAILFKIYIKFCKISNFLVLLKNLGWFSVEILAWHFFLSCQSSVMSDIFIEILATLWSLHFALFIPVSHLLKMTLQYLGHLMWRAHSLEKTLLLRKIECRMRKEWQRLRWLDGITDSVDTSLRELWEIMKVRQVWCTADHGVTNHQTHYRDWTTTTPTFQRSWF